MESESGHYEDFLSFSVTMETVFVDTSRMYQEQPSSPAN